MIQRGPVRGHGNHRADFQRVEHLFRRQLPQHFAFGCAFVAAVVAGGTQLGEERTAVLGAEFIARCQGQHDSEERWSQAFCHKDLEVL